MRKIRVISKREEEVETVLSSDLVKFRAVDIKSLEGDIVMSTDFDAYNIALHTDFSWEIVSISGQLSLIAQKK